MNRKLSVVVNSISLATLFIMMAAMIAAIDLLAKPLLSAAANIQVTAKVTDPIGFVTSVGLDATDVGYLHIRKPHSGSLAVTLQSASSDLILRLSLPEEKSIDAASSVVLHPLLATLFDRKRRQFLFEAGDSCMVTLIYTEN